MKRTPAVLSLMVGFVLGGWAIYHYAVTLAEVERQLLPLNANKRLVQQQLTEVNNLTAIIAESSAASKWALSDGSGSFNDDTYIEYSRYDYWPDALGAEMLKKSREEASLTGKQRVFLVFLRKAEHRYIVEAAEVEQRLRSIKRLINIGVVLAVVFGLLLPLILLRITD